MFQLQASGFLKVLLCVVTVRGSRLVEVPPGLSTLPAVTLAVGWNGGLPPRNTESLTPRRVRKRPAPVRMTVLSLLPYAIPTRGWKSFHWMSENREGAPRNR